MSEATVTKLNTEPEDEITEDEQKFGKRTKVKIIDKTEPAQKLKKEHHFHVEARSVIDSEMYSGDFTAKKMTLGSQGKVGVILSRLNEGLQVDATTSFVNRMIAQCAVSLTRTPEWFKDMENFYDMDILAAIYGEVMAFEASFRKVVRE